MNKSNESKIAKDLLCDASCKTCKHKKNWQVSQYIDSQTGLWSKKLLHVCEMKVDLSKTYRYNGEENPNMESIITDNQKYCEEYDGVLEKERT